KGNDPDELYLNAAISLCGLDPSFSTPIHYPIRNASRLQKAWNIETIRNQSELNDKYFILSYAGDGKNISPFGKKVYNNTMKQVLEANKLPHVRKIELLLKKKFILTNG
ncbi:MAG: hypothetical protein R3321_09695, partial [Nitrososphaeraceae archaeon]|nr:hypothetical protein [Nitrososphaeraceae archaeon]